MPPELFAITADDYAAATNYVEDLILPADTLVRVAIPSFASVVNVTTDSNHRLKFGSATTTFSLPTATTSDGSGSVLNPGVRRVPKRLTDGSRPTHVILRSDVACKGSVEFWG